MTEQQTTLEQFIEEARAVPVDTPSFSEVIIGLNSVQQRCNLGHLHVVYRIRWRRIYPEVLRLFLHGPMTTSQVGMYFSGGAGATARKSPSELVHFGLLEPDGWRKGDQVYRLTDRGRRVLAGEEPVPEWVWPTGVELPEQCRPGPPKWLDEMPGFDPKDRAAHVELAEPEVNNCKQ